MCTTKDNLEAMKIDIDQRMMPLVLQEAIKVCRALSIRYLWVDCLCIIQDDVSDWESESALMSLVYGHALVNLHFKFSFLI